MAFEQYGGVVWEDRYAEPQRDWKGQTLTFGVAAGLGLTTASYLTHPQSDGTRRLDDVARVARTAGNLSPFQIGNTFRLPEFLSPWTSPKYQGLDDVGDGIWEARWGGEHLQNKSTYQYLQSATGLSPDELAAKGINDPGVRGIDEASELIFRRTAESSRGELFFKSPKGKETLLSKSIQLQAFNKESPDFLNYVSESSSVNRAAMATMQAMGLFSEEGFKHHNVFKRSAAEEVTDATRNQLTPSFIPVPALNLKPDSLGGLDRGTTLLRALPAFSMERFNRLLEGLTEHTVGRGALDFFKRTLGAGTEVRPGKASAMYWRFGSRVGALAGVGLGIAQMDWMRRQFGTPGEVLAAGATSAGVSWLTSKIPSGGGTLSGKTAFMAGLASFAGQMILPGWDDGVLPGLATTYAKATEIRGMAINPANYYRRTLEGFLPGISDWKTGAALGIGAMALSYGHLPFAGFTPAHGILRGRHEMFGIPKHVPTGPLEDMKFARPGPGGIERPVVQEVFQTRRPRDIFWEKMGLSRQAKEIIGGSQKEIRQAFNDSDGYVNFSIRNLVRNAYKKEWRNRGYTRIQGMTEWSRLANSMWSEAEQIHKSLTKEDPMTKAMLLELEDVGRRYSGKAGALNTAKRWLAGLKTQYKYSFFGAKPYAEDAWKSINSMGFKAPVGRLGLLFGGTMMAQQVLTGGLFGSMESAEELRRIYSGQQDVAVGKSRWWEGGGTPYEGMRTDYYRPHWYALMKNRVRERGIWGEDEDKISPIGKFIKRNFTYELERQNYYDRPYPITSGAFSDWPIIGRLLSSTVGRLFKQPRLMHVNEWVRPGADGNMEFASTYEGWRREPAYNLGATGPGVPRSPFGAANELAFFNYQFRELEGLTGWVKNTISDTLFGTSEYLVDRPQLAEAGAMTSHRQRFWELSTGGMGFMNEFIRRIFPNYRHQIETINPIPNSMPEWLPERFHYGDPYREVEWGEARLPGPGYAALHPELEGVDPQDYPLAYQYDILADVAPFTKEFRRKREQVYRLRQQGGTTPAVDEWIDRIDREVRDRYNRYEFGRVEDQAIQLPGSGLTQGMWFGGQKALRSAAAPAEYLIPFGFRPVQKLLGESRDPIERYEWERMYGTPYAFWDQPWRDWLRPSMYSAMSFFGFEGKPMWREEADQTQAHFDQIEFVKWMSMAERASKQGDVRNSIRYQYMAGSTRMGVNPQGNPMSIYWSLPAEERAFFNSFALAEGSDRERILEMVPGDQQHLYKAVWSRRDQGDPTLWAGADGRPDYWHMLDQYYNMNNPQPMPSEDWIGWHEDVDVRDIKVKYIDEMGRDIHDFGMWESQLRGARRQPYLDDSTTYLHRQGGPIRGGVYSDTYKMFGTGMRAPQMMINPSQGFQSHVDLGYDDTRDAEMLRAAQEYTNAY